MRREGETPNHEAVHRLTEQTNELAAVNDEFEGAQSRMERAEGVLGAIRGFSDDPAGEVMGMLNQARASSESEAIIDSDRVADLAIIDNLDTKHRLAVDMNNQLDSQDPAAAIRAIADLRDTNPEGAARLADNLDSVRYLHGSAYPFKIGDKITPGQYGIEADGMLHASATTNEEEAWFYAQDKEGVNGPRARVHEVVSSDGLPARQLGPQRSEVNSRTFTVVGMRDVKPGLQGTIPEVNWNDYSDSLYMNHPEDPHFISENDYNEPSQVSLTDMTLPGLGEDYVRAQRARTHKEKYPNRPDF